MSAHPTDRPSPDVAVAIVGGGITGLAALHALAVDGTAGDAVLLEAASRVGGKIVTERAAGLVIEGGPDSFLAAKPEALALCRALGIAARLRAPDPARRRAFVRRRGRLHELPGGVSGLVPSRLWPLLTTRLLSPSGRLRAGLEILVPPRRDAADETVAEFAIRRFGREAYTWLVEPLLGGIHAADARALSLAATFPRLAQLERTHGSVLRAMLAARSDRTDGATRPPAFLAPAGGMGEIVEALERTLPPDAVQRGARVVSIERVGTGYRLVPADGAAVTARAVILATPACVTARLVEALDAELAARLREIPFVSTATVSLAFPRAAVPSPLEGSGYLSPRAEAGAVVACTWVSSKFPDRAPPDTALFRLFIGRAGREEVLERSDAGLVELAREELHTTLGITGDPALARVFRWPQGMPQYIRGHLARVADIERRAAAHRGLHLAGASYRGAGVPDCIASGAAAARGAARDAQAASTAGS